MDPPPPRFDSPLRAVSGTTKQLQHTKHLQSTTKQLQQTTKEQQQQHTQRRSSSSRPPEARLAFVHPLWPQVGPKPGPMNWTHRRHQSHPIASHRIPYIQFPDVSRKRWVRPSSESLDAHMTQIYILGSLITRSGNPDNFPTNPIRENA